MRLLAAHIIVSAYGFWLPNDPRGSWSEFVGAWELFRYGPATKLTTRQSVAHVPHNRELRLRAKGALKRQPVRFSGMQARAIGRGFARAVEEGSYRIHACAILHDHVHLVIAAHLQSYEQIVAHLKGRATQRLRAEGLNPFCSDGTANGQLASPWARRFWKVYCHDADHVRNAIRCVEVNPVREGLKPQRWTFVVPYELSHSAVEASKFVVCSADGTRLRSGRFPLV